MRISRAELAEWTQSLRSRFGETPVEFEDGQIITHPPGTPVPTQPGRTPGRSLPRTRGVGAWAETAIDLACSLYNPSPGGFIDRYLDFSEYTNSRSVADGLLRLICGEPPGSPEPGGGGPPPPPPEFPFFGGQCEFQYDVVVSYVIESLSGGACTNVNRTYSGFDWWGPIGGFRVRVTGDRFGILEILAHGNGSTRRDTQMWETLTPVNSSVGCAPPRYASATVTPADGGPDSCGSLPPEPANPPGSEPPPNPLPPATVDPGDGGPPVTIEPEIGIEIGPGGPGLSVGLDGINFFIDVGGVDINFPSAPSECCPPNALEPSPDDREPEPGTPVEPPPPEVPPGPGPEEERGRVIRAVIVTCTNISTPATPIRPSSGGPTVFAPRLATLQFKIAAGDGSTGWTSDIDIKNAQQYVQVPALQGAVDVSVFPYGTASVKIVRLYQTIQSDIQEISP